MTKTARFLKPSEAARALGVSTKSLRIYERQGLVTPQRTASGWRSYAPEDMGRLTTIVALRDLGLSLAQIAQALRDDPGDLEPALAAHQAFLEDQRRQVDGTIRRIRAMRADLALPKAGRKAAAAAAARPLRTAFDLPWPWGGEAFELNDIRPINYITGPLGSGKTRLARAFADHLPGAAFVGLERLKDGCAGALQRMEREPGLAQAVERMIAGLVEDGASASPALTAVLVAVGDPSRGAMVIDLVEQDLDQGTQAALTRDLRANPPATPLFLLTRSRSILDMRDVGADETVILCPANHSPPVTVAPDPQAFGYEAVATCLAAPEVRARTEGMIAVRPSV